MTCSEMDGVDFSLFVILKDAFETWNLHKSVMHNVDKHEYIFFLSP